MPTSRYSAVSGDWIWPQSGPDSGQLPLLSETNTASESSQSIGRECRSTGMLRKLLPTPVVTDSFGSRNKTSGRKPGSKHHDGTTLNDWLRLEGQSQFSPVGSLANLIPLQENVRRLLTSVIYGQSAPGSQQSFALDGPSLRTCRDYLQASGAHSSPAFSVTWPRWGIASDGEFGELTMLVPFTDATECSSWRTPDTHKCGGAQDATKRAAGGHGVRLQDQVKMWPTPAAQDAKNATLPRSQTERDTVPGALIRQGSVGALNPMWVEWLQGFPSGWTDLER